VPVRELADRFEVSPKTIYNVINHGRAARSSNCSRTRVLTIRITDADLHRFDAALSRRGIAHRSDAMRRLMLAAEGVFVPDDDMSEDLRRLAAALNRVGNNVNQIARRLNEAKVRGESLPYSAASHREIRSLAGLVFDISDQIQEMSRARRTVLELELTAALAGLVEGRAQTEDPGGVLWETETARRRTFHPK
jgi:transposase